MSDEPEKSLPPPAANENDSEKPSFLRRKWWLVVFALLILAVWLPYQWFMQQNSPVASSPVTSRPKYSPPAVSAAIEAVEEEPDFFKPEIVDEEVADEPAPLPSHTSEEAVEAISEPAPDSEEEQPDAELNPATASVKEPLSAELDELLTKITQKNKEISTLQCALKLQAHAHEVSTLGMVLKQCYALLVTAGVTQGDIRTLSEAAQQAGVPDKQLLKSTFLASIAPALRVREQTHVEESVWYRTIREYITDSITIRKTGWQEGDSAEAIIGRAEAYLNNDNINDAFLEIQSLPEAVKKPFQEWLKQVKMIRALKRVLQQLSDTTSDDVEAEDGR